MNRRLLTTRRLIPLDRLDEYLSAWHAVRTAAQRAGGRAWMFRGAAHQDHFVEFLEWQDGGRPPLHEEPAVGGALRDLADRFGAGNTDEWEEVPGA